MVRRINRILELKKTTYDSKWTILFINQIRICVGVRGDAIRTLRPQVSTGTVLGSMVTYQEAN